MVEVGLKLMHPNAQLPFFATEGAAHSTINLNIKTMIRISRIIAKNKICDLLGLDNVTKVEIRQSKQKFNNPHICRVLIYFTINGKYNSDYLNQVIDKIFKWAKDNKNNTAKTTAQMAYKDGFIKESAFDDFDFPFPEKYKELCDKYSQEFFNEFNLQ